MVLAVGSMMSLTFCFICLNYETLKFGRLCELITLLRKYNCWRKNFRNSCVIFYRRFFSSFCYFHLVPFLVFEGKKNHRLDCR